MMNFKEKLNFKISNYQALNFKEGLKYITGENRLKRAEEWMKHFIEARPAAAPHQKLLKKWFAEKNDLHLFAAGFFCLSFIKWKKEEKSRSARVSSLRRKPRA